MADQNTLQQLIDSLKQRRDELKLQMHLAEMEARDEFNRLSDKFEELTSEYQPIKDAVAKSAEGAVEALTLTAEEVKKGFARIADSLKRK